MPLFRLIPRRRWWWLALLLVLVGLGLALLLALQRQPLLALAPEGSNAQLATQARLLWAQLRPGAAPAGMLRQTRLGQRELNALLDQAALMQGRRWRAQLRIEAENLQLQASHPAPLLPSYWLNLQLVWDLREPLPGQLPPLQSARIGQLPLPPALVEWAARRWLQRHAGDSLDTLLPMLEGWRAAPQHLWLRWRWQPERAAEAVAALWPQAERAALLAQHQHLRQVLTGLPRQAVISVAQLLQPLAQLAEQRAASVAGSDAGTELRAMLMTVALQSVQRDISPWLPEARAEGPLTPVLLQLAGRDDMASHFLLAAVLSWRGGERLANALGLAKELADARVGSGFSFNDLAADEAGTRFGTLSARAPAQVLARLAAGVKESELFPDIADLPEFLSEREFRRRYGQVGSPAYQAEMARVRERVAAVPMLQGFPQP
jgi:uncharacterized protein YfiM (DUF2279 family)